MMKPNLEGATNIHAFIPSGVTLTGVELCAVCGASERLYVHSSFVPEGAEQAAKEWTCPKCSKPTLVDGHCLNCGSYTAENEELSDEQVVRQIWKDARLVQWMILWPDNTKAPGFQVEGTPYTKFDPKRTRAEAWASIRSKLKPITMAEGQIYEAEKDWYEGSEEQRVVAQCDGGQEERPATTLCDPPEPPSVGQEPKLLEHPEFTNRLMNRVTELESELASLREQHRASRISDQNTITAKCEEVRELYTELQSLREKESAARRTFWFNEARPVINAIGEISVQEAMDGIEKHFLGGAK